jgi:outer membrane protein TolC
MVGYIGPGLTDPEYPAVRVLGMILGGGMSGRLFTELRDRRGLAYQVGVLGTYRTGPSFLLTYMGTAPANVEASDASVMFAVAQAFYSAAGADEVLVARNSSINVARAPLANAKTRMAAGTVTKVDVDRAELALVRAEQLERDARHGRNQAYRALATLIQMPDTERFVVQPPVAIATPTDVPDLQNALQLRPELRSLNLQLKAEELHARSYAWRWAPSLSAFGNARKFNYDNFRGDRYSWAVGVQLDWVLFDGGNRDAQRHLADAQAVESQAQAAVFADTGISLLVTLNGMRLLTARNTQGRS